MGLGMLRPDPQMFAQLTFIQVRVRVRVRIRVGVRVWVWVWVMVRPDPRTFIQEP